MNQQTKATIRTITTVMVFIAIIFAFLISGIRIFGFQVYGVLSGSMEPAYPVGSLVYVKACDVDELKVRDVITFSASAKTVVTHRIVEVVPDENNPNIKRFRTRGDANDDVDASLVGEADIIGKVVFSVPHLGNVASYIQQPPGIYVAILLGIVLVVFVVITDNAAGDEKSKNQGAAPQQPKKQLDLPWLSNLLAKVGIQWPKQKAPPQQPLTRQGYVPGQAQQQYTRQGYQPQQQYPQQGYQPQQQYTGQGYQPQQQYTQQGYQPQQQYPQQGYQYPQQQYPQQGYQYPQQQYPQPGYQQYPQQQYPQQGYQYPQQQYPQPGYQQYPQQPYAQQQPAQAAPQQPQQNNRS
ncbi:MAG: signal peptidase I [Clostridia bacterium]|nr:signal peptidase I [Clostridia bacterium]